MISENWWDDENAEELDFNKQPALPNLSHGISPPKPQRQGSQPGGGFSVTITNISEEAVVDDIYEFFDVMQIQYLSITPNANNNELIAKFQSESDVIAALKLDGTEFIDRPLTIARTSTSRQQQHRAPPSRVAPPPRGRQQMPNRRASQPQQQLPSFDSSQRSSLRPPPIPQGQAPVPREMPQSDDAYSDEEEYGVQTLRPTSPLRHPPPQQRGRGGFDNFRGGRGGNNNLRGGRDLRGGRGGSFRGGRSQPRDDHRRSNRGGRGMRQGNNMRGLYGPRGSLNQRGNNSRGDNKSRPPQNNNFRRPHNAPNNNRRVPVRQKPMVQMGRKREEKAFEGTQEANSHEMLGNHMRNRTAQREKDSEGFESFKTKREQRKEKNRKIRQSMRGRGGRNQRGGFLQRNDFRQDGGDGMGNMNNRGGFEDRGSYQQPRNDRFAPPDRSSEYGGGGGGGRFGGGAQNNNNYGQNNNNYGQRGYNEDQQQQHNGGERYPGPDGMNQFNHHNDPGQQMNQSPQDKTEQPTHERIIGGGRGGMMAGRASRRKQMQATKKKQKKEKVHIPEARFGGFGALLLDEEDQSDGDQEEVEVDE